MTDPVNPEHYKFSDGVELISVTENLTSNGGQAVQYIARATRIDPRLNKGNPIEDLNKAIWFCQRELYRLGEGVRDRILDAKVRAEIPDEERFFMDRQAKKPRVWDNWDDIPQGVRVNSKDESDGEYPWHGSPGDGPFGNAPWREVLDV